MVGVPLPFLFLPPGVWQIGLFNELKPQTISKLGTFPVGHDFTILETSYLRQPGRIVFPVFFGYRYIQVYLNGLFLTEGTDYTVIKSGPQWNVRLLFVTPDGQDIVKIVLYRT